MAEEKGEDKQRLISTKECAERHGLTRQSITDACHRGDLKAVMVGRHYVLTVEECESYKPILNRQEGGRRGGIKSGESRKKPTPAAPPPDPAARQEEP